MELFKKISEKLDDFIGIYIRPKTLKIKQGLLKLLEIDLFPFTGVFLWLILWSNGKSFLESLTIGVLGYFVFLRIEQFIHKYAMLRRSSK